jgi:hypothetical protein
VRINDPEPIVLLALALWGIARAGRRLSASMGSDHIVLLSVGVAIASYLVWSVLMMGGVLQVDPLLRSLGVSGREQPWPAVILLGPPAIAALVFGVSAARARRRRP